MFKSGRGRPVAVRSIRGVPQLAALPLEARPSWPLVSIIIPAKDEAAEIEGALKSKLQARYAPLELVVVDDRSTDETGDILDCLAASNPSLQVRHIRALPEGWLGKNHALHVAGREARGEWLLFTDADVVYLPGALSRAMARSRV